MKKLRIIFKVVIVALALAFLSRCANPVSPSGGPKDTKAPNFVKAEPPLFTCNFDKKRIRVYFDEFVTLKDVSQQLIISPPMNESPKITSRGKSIQIDFEEPLKDSTTYTLFFGDAIVDITENNPASNFLYVFSTGDVLDSLTLKGKVLDAFNNDPLPNVSLLLYLDNNDTIPYDSLPYFVKPYFMTRSLSSGDFTFNNLPDKPFKLFALEDLNGTLTFDQPAERIAFVDSLVKPYYITPAKVDSIPNDTLIRQADSIVHDSLINKQLKDKLDELITHDEHPLIELKLFQETDSIQKFLKASLIKPQNIAFIFKNKVIDPSIELIDTVIENKWFIREDGVVGDTIFYWLTQVPSDSLTFVIADNGKILDTTRISIVPAEKSRRQKKEEETKVPKMKPEFMRTSPVPGQPFFVKFPYPIKSFNPTPFMMIEGDDTLTSKFTFTDSIKRKAIMERDWLESTRYRFVIPDSVFTDIRELSHDTLYPSFNTKAIADYGNFYLDISIEKECPNYIIQLFEGDKKSREMSVSEAGRVSFEYLNPATYEVKVIYDMNNNGEWDTGDYHYRIHPEEVNFFPKEIVVRANWDVVESWEL